MVNFIEKKYYHYVNEKYLYIADNTVTSAIRHTTGQFTNCKEIITVIRLNESFHVSKFWEYIPIQSSYQDTNIHWYCENHEDCYINMIKTLNEDRVLNWCVWSLMYTTKQTLPKKTCLQMKIINCYYSYFLNEGDERFDWKLNVKYVSNKIK